ncbi:MAG: polysaccharide biosynthesis C-terminal domain-containing protein [Cytophagaceae bacterium]
MSVIKQLLGQTAMYGISSMLGRAINFLLVPFYTALLLPDAYGVVTDLYAYAAFFNILFLYGMETTYFRYSSKPEHTEEYIFNHIFTQIIISTVFLVAVLVVFINPIAHFTEYTSSKDYLYLFIVILATDALLAIPFARWRKENKAGWFAGVKLGAILFNVFLNILLVAYIPEWLEGAEASTLKEWVLSWYRKEDQVYYIFLSNLISNALQAPFLISALHHYRWTLDRLLIPTLWKYAWPLMIMGFAGMVNEMLDRLLLKKLLPDNFYFGQTSIYALGVYGACYKLSMFMTLTVQSFRFAAEPFFFNRAAEKDSPELFAKVLSVFTIICLAIFLGVSINIDLFKEFLRNEAYWSGLSVVPILLMANLLLGIYYQQSIWYKLTDKTIWGSRISIIGAVITIVGNLLCIPFFGYIGAAWVTFACYASMVIISYYLGQKYFPVPYRVVQLCFWIFVSGVIVAVYWWMRQNEIPGAVYYANLIAFLWLTFMYLQERKSNSAKAK